MSSGDLADLLRAGGYDNDRGNQYSANLSEISKEVQRRVRALKAYQLEAIKLEGEFYARVHQLELEFQPLFNAIYEKRKNVVSGEYEPTDSDCQLPLVHNLNPEKLQKFEDNAPVEGSPSKGIPDFWYHVLNNTAQIDDTICEYDEPILKYLTDITTEVHNEPTGFSLYFHFSENPYFTNAVLKKYYELKLDADSEHPFDYDGPTVVKSEGTQINWKENKNVTQKVVKEKQKKGTGAGRFITKTVSNDSFFNFFDPAVKVLSQDEEDSEEQEAVRVDFEIGQLIRDQVIPRAVLFYTGEAVDEEIFEDEVDDSSVDDGSDDDE